MAYYDALIAKWPTLTSGTTAAKITQINAIKVNGDAVPMIVPSYMVYNLIDSTEFNALSADLQQKVRDILFMGTIDVSNGTATRKRIVEIFPNGTITFTALANLAAKYDTPKILWPTATVAQGGGGLVGPVNMNDCNACGLT